MHPGAIRLPSVTGGTLGGLNTCFWRCRDCPPFKVFLDLALLPCRLFALALPAFPRLVRVPGRSMSRCVFPLRLGLRLALPLALPLAPARCSRLRPVDFKRRHAELIHHHEQPFVFSHLATDFVHHLHKRVFIEGDLIEGGEWGEDTSRGHRHPVLLMQWP